MAPSLKPSVYAITAQYCHHTLLAGNRCPLANPIAAQQSGPRPGAVKAAVDSIADASGQSVFAQELP
jgi:hypothetical protein